MNRAVPNCQRWGMLGSSLVLMLVFARPGWAEEPPANDAAPVSSEFRERSEGFTAHWQLLRLPELATRLVLTPLFPLVALAEQTRLDLRLYDLATNPERTRFLIPLFTAYTNDGVGGGLLYVHNDAFGGGEHIELYALTTTIRDIQLNASYSEELSALNGRRMGLAMNYDLDRNNEYDGIGATTDEKDLRALEVSELGLALEIDVGAPNTFFRTGFGSEARIGYLRERLGPGRIVGPPVSADDPEVPPPPGFEEPIDYANLEWTFRYDQRDSLGRTQRGAYVGVAFSASSDLDDKDLSAAKVHATFSYFLPVAPRYRVLVLTLGGATATPLAADAEIPLHQLVTLGRTTSLRGYSKDRFRDSSGWWVNLEYRYPLFEFQDTGAGLSAALFVDAGGVGPTIREMWGKPVRYTPGIGLRAEAPSAFVFRAQAAYSPEGIEAGLSLSEHYDL